MTNGSRVPSQKQFKQRAAGEFRPTIVAGTNHCGINDEVGNFRYEVEICYRGGTEILDSQGFLLDNLTFEQYFKGLQGITLSCETLAMEACAHFELQLGARIKHVKSIVVKIFPFGEVFVEATSEPVVSPWNESTQVEAISR